MKLVRGALPLFFPAVGVGCAIPGDSRGPQPLTANVFHWKVVDEASSAELAHGCGKDVNARAKQIKFSAPAGARVVETVLYEMVAKNTNRPNYPFDISREEDDAYWCGVTEDAWRKPIAFQGNIECARPYQPAQPATIVSRETITNDGGMGGYRLALEILRPGTLSYEEDPFCPFGWINELTVLAP